MATRNVNNGVTAFISDELIRAMRIKSMGASELAAKVGMTERDVNLIREGRRPVNEREAHQLAKVLNVAIDYLTGGIFSSHVIPGRDRLTITPSTTYPNMPGGL